MNSPVSLYEVNVIGFRDFLKAVSTLRSAPGSLPIPARSALTLGGSLKERRATRLKENRLAANKCPESAPGLSVPGPGAANLIS